MTALAITGMGLTGVLRLTWVQDNLAHVLQHSQTDETSGTWTGLACPGHGLPLGADVDNAVLQEMGAGTEIADLIWEAPDQFTAEHTQAFRDAHACSRDRRRRSRPPALGEPPGHLVTRLVIELRGARVHARHRPDPLLAGQAPALGDRLLRAPHQPPRPSPAPRAQHRDPQSDNWGITSMARSGHPHRTSRGSVRWRLSHRRRGVPSPGMKLSALLDRTARRSTIVSVCSQRPEATTRCRPWQATANPHPPIDRRSAGPAAGATHEPRIS